MDCLEAFVSRMETWLEIITYVVLGFIFFLNKIYFKDQIHTTKTTNGHGTIIVCLNK